MKNTKISIGVAVIAIFIAGCSTVTIEGGGSKDDIVSAPITIHGSMYGFDWQNKKGVIFAKDSKGRVNKSLYSVCCHTNYFYLLTGVLSFGLYYPQTFEYTLTVPQKTDSENEPGYNPFKKKTPKKRGNK